MNSYRVEGSRFLSSLQDFRLSRGLVFGVLIIAALFAFEIFNYSTTDFALNDLLGDLRFAGVRWATILAIAFCGIDFAGIARLFTPEEGSNEPNEVWYLFAAWLLAATMNAMLTWWGVSIAMSNHTTGTSVVDPQTVVKVAPVFVAVLVWLIRVLIIGTFSVAGERLFSQSTVDYTAERARVQRDTRLAIPAQSRSLSPNRSTSPTRTVPAPAPAFNAPRPTSNRPTQRMNSRPALEIEEDHGPSHPKQEPTYHPLGYEPRRPNNGNGNGGSGGYRR